MSIVSIGICRGRFLSHTSVPGPDCQGTHSCCLLLLMPAQHLLDMCPVVQDLGWKKTSLFWRLGCPRIWVKLSWRSQLAGNRGSQRYLLVLLDLGLRTANKHNQAPRRSSPSHESVIYSNPTSSTT